MSQSPEKWSDEELRDQVGQLFIVGFHGHTPSENIKTLIKEYRVGSIILFQRNVKDAKQLQRLTSDLQAIAKESGHTQPLFIGIDQENGLITRIKEPTAAQLPGSMTLAATGDVKDAYNVGLMTAIMLRNYGINFDYAPVADTNSNPKNPVIGVRSPSDDPETVARVVAAQSHGLRDGNVIGCVKHFPGHGDTAVDSHFGSPVLEKTRQQMEDCEFLPFRRAVSEGIDAVMTAHIVTSNIAGAGLGADHKLKEIPASLNPDVIAILREDFGFDGLVVSDCLEMDGVRAKFGTAKGAFYALQVGSDCAMICHTFSAQVDAICHVVEAVKSNQLREEDIKKSVRRVRDLKDKHMLSFEQDDKPIDSREIFLDQQRIAADIYAKSTALVRHTSTTFPLSKDLTKIILLTPAQIDLGSGAIESGDPDTEDSVTGTSYTAIIEAISPDSRLEVVEIQFHKDIALSPDSEKMIDTAPAVILATRNALLNAHQREFGLALGRRLGEKLITIATCEPYDFLNDSNEIQNYITIYEPTLAAFKAAVDVVFGLRPALGKLPLKCAMIDYGKEITVVGDINDDQITQVAALWSATLPEWPITINRLGMLLRRDHCICLLHTYGFCITYLHDGTGKLAVLGVVPEHRNKGLGTALIKQARKQLDTLGEVKNWSLGSVFPRLWAGVPFDIDGVSGEFFTHRGFRKSKTPTSRDLFRDISQTVATPEVLERVSKLHVEFVPWSKDLEEETLAKQEANFGRNRAWVQAYHDLASQNQHSNVLVAIDPETKAQIGWTIMSSHSTIIADDFAFLPLCPSGNKTGLIACVGVDENARGRGVGLGLLVKAMKDMSKRGVKGVLIDWVVIRGFYETLGFVPRWEYESYEWPMK